MTSQHYAPFSPIAIVSYIVGYRFVGQAREHVSIANDLLLVGSPFDFFSGSMVAGPSRNTNVASFSNRQPIGLIRSSRGPPRRRLRAHNLRNRTSVGTSHVIMRGVSLGVSTDRPIRRMCRLKNLRLTSNPARGAIRRRVYSDHIGNGLFRRWVSRELSPD
jgi:hypothetical protein